MYYFKDKSIYTGGFKNNLFEGNGKLEIKLENGNSEFLEGEFSHGLLNCTKGIYTNEKGEVFIGSFKDNCAEGEGQI